MIKAELAYNPYLGETIVSFNGQSPRINSLVEKYQGKILNDWVDRIPSIYRDEMNGFGFEFDFSGTHLDYLSLQEAFRNQGVSKEDVPIFFKNELEPRTVKVERIEKLLDWLKDHPNRHFDYASFKVTNSSLLDDLYIYKILQGEGIDTESLKNEDIAAEIIEDVHELNATDLTHIPILVYVSAKTIDKLSYNTKYLLKRHDVNPNQIFFYIEESCNREIITRTIVDLGINNPQIASAIYDEKIRRYFEIYPISEYISQTISVLHKMTQKLQSELNKQARENQISERNASTTVFKADFKIKELKKLDESFENRDNIDLPSSFTSPQEELKSKILSWRNKKTVITNESEAAIVAQEFEMMFKGAYEVFWNSININLIRAEEDIRSKYQALYASGGIDQYRPGVEPTSRIPSYSVPNIKDQLVSIKDERYVLPKEGIIDQVFKGNNTNKFMERVINFYFKDWREYVLKLASDLTDKEIELRFNMLKQYADDLSKAFRAHISYLLDIEINNKNSEMNHLSEAEKQMQLDTDWLNSVVDQLNVIERG